MLLLWRGNSKRLGKRPDKREIETNETGNEEVANTFTPTIE
jgi:hypothetical protein